MIELTEEQQIIRDSVARYLSENYSFDQRQQQVRSADGFDPDQWRAFAELGWLGMPFPEECGGAGGSWIDAAIIAEQLGRTLLRSPYLSSVIGAGTVLLAADEPQKTKYLTRIAEGQTLIACAFEEKTLASKLASGDPTRAAKTKDGFALTGIKSLVPYAKLADQFIVSALLDDRLHLFLVPAQAGGVEITPYKMYDGGRAGDLALSGVALDSDSRLPGDATSAIRAVVDNESALLCAEAAGIMWSVQEQTVEYLKTREQFGQKLGEFQALQHRLVDMYVQCQLAQSLAWDAVDAVAHEADASKRSRRVSAAKAYIGEVGRAVGKESVQLHGGIGMTDEIPIGHYLKRLTTIDHLHGNSAEHRSRFRALDDFSPQSD
jgi:alkylation response protein AidB-like acyl-CoA dehydrogenase